MSGVLRARFPTTCSGVRPLPTSFSGSARVPAKKRGVIILVKKLSSQFVSSKLNDSSADLSKIGCGPGALRP